MASSSQMGKGNLLVPGMPGPQRASLNGNKPQQTVFTTTEDLHPPSGRTHPLLPIGITMIFMLLVIVAWNGIGVPFVQHIQNQWHYGDSKVVALDVQLQGDPVTHTVAAWVYQDHSGATWLLVTSVAKGEKPTQFEVSAHFPDGPDTVLTLWIKTVNGSQGIAISTQGDPNKTAMFLYGDGHGNLSWSPPKSSVTFGG